MKALYVLMMDQQGCHGYGYPWIYPWIYPWTFLFILIQMTDITISE